MSNNGRELRKALSQIEPAEKVTLILPFTPSTLIDPTPFLPAIHDILFAIPTTSLVAYFSTPDSEQLYDTLTQNPKAHWEALQSFLSQVYGTLAAAQWACGKVDISVDVGFASSTSGHKGRIGESDVVLYLDWFEDQDLLSGLDSGIPIYALPSSVTLPSVTWDPPPPSPGPEVVALGGTFDHLHAAHKLLLQLSYFLATRKLIVGVMSASQLSSKQYAGYLQDSRTRQLAVQRFLAPLGQIEIEVVEIHDPFGPTQDDEDIQALVVSDETRSGGEAVNTKRRENGLGKLEVWCIDVISGKSQHGYTGEEENDKSEDSVVSDGPMSKSGILKGMDEKKLKEVKMGSTDIRRRLAEKDGRS